MTPEPVMILTWNLDQYLNLTRNVKKNLTVTSYQQTAIIIFLIYDQFGAIQKLNSRRIVYKTYIFINSDLLSYKNWKQN